MNLSNTGRGLRTALVAVLCAYQYVGAKRAAAAQPLDS